MNSIQISVAIVSGICFYVGSYHLLVGLRRRPRDLVHIFFALTSMGFGIYNFSQILLHPAVAAGSASDFISADRWGLAGNLLGKVFLLWFVAFYARVKPYFVLVTLSAAYGILLLVNFTTPGTYLYYDVTGFFPVTLPWGESVTFADIALTKWAILNQPLLLLSLVYLIYAGIRQYHRGERRKALLLGLGMAIFVVTIINDQLLDFGFITSIYLLQFGYVALIVTMSLVLSDEIIGTERELELLTIELEQRIQERTAELSKAKNVAEAAANELQESEDRLDHVLRSARLAVWEYDLQTRETAVTDMFPHLLGYDPSDILLESDKKWRGYKLGHQSLAAKLLHPDDKERYAEKLGEMIDDNETFEVEYRLRMANGQWNWMRDHGKIVKWDISGNPLLAYGVVMDIDKMKHLQLELMSAKDAAEAANRAKTVFLANMSHELRTPLNAILGHAQIISRDRSLRPEQNDGIRAINRSGDHLLTLINSVLEMSKIEAGRANLNPTHFNIESLISDMEIIFGDRAREKGLEFIIEKDPQIISSVEADRGKISQILINLLSNAVRYTQNGVITLRVMMAAASGEQRHLIFEVEDTGEGIAAQDLKRIFDPFVQSDAGRPQQTGTGLGLAISHEYARLMDGDLTVQSRLGQGSIFRLMTPALAVESARSETERKNLRKIVDIAGENRKFRVLVVDDEGSNRDVLIRMLSPAGFDIHEAESGQAAIAQFETWSPHLILMDIRMPVMNGIQAIQKIKSTEQGRTTPIIGVSASVFEEEQNKVLESGADDFLAKPIQETELWEKLGKCLKVEVLVEDQKQLTVESTETVPLTRKDIAALPNETVAAMQEAVKDGHMQRMSDLARSAADHHLELSQRLLKLIDHYDYEALFRLFLQNFYDAGNKDA